MISPPSEPNTNSNARWTILRFTARQIRDEPYVVLAQLAAALAQSGR